MRSRSSRLTMTTSAAMVSGLLALASVGTAYAQGAAAQPAGPAKPPAATPAQPAGAAKPAAAQPAGAAKPAQPGGAAKPEPPKKQLTEAQKKAEAKKLYKEAEAKFDKGEYKDALPLYRQADEHVPGAPPKYKIALSLDKMGGQVPETVAAWQAFLDAKPDPEKFKDKIAEAQGRIDSLKKTPAKVKIATVPENPPNLKVSVDDGPPQSVRELSIPPGRHKLTVSADGFATATQEVEVSFAETRDVSVPLTEKAPEPTPVAVPPPVEPPPGPVEPVQPPPEPRSPVPAYVTLGLAGVGVVVGTIFGISALGAKSDFEAEPTTENADAVDRNALIADMSFAVALTFGVTGAVLLFSADDAPEAPAAPAEPAAPPAGAKKRSPIKKAFVAPFVGPTGGGAAARFTF
jgi:hypothetical protein